ncbi:MAG: hypothetical protein M5U28_07850 [Sandaracinaceae bacterium]|nr:hypothetical protein [Sandaracinaceae bacterium]
MSTSRTGGASAPRDATSESSSTCPPSAITRAPPRSTVHPVRSALTSSVSPSRRTRRLRTNQRSPACSTARASSGSMAPARPGKWPAASTRP